jgi:hypothetical protein
MGRDGKLRYREYPDISPNTSDQAGVNSEIPHSNGGVPGGKNTVTGTSHHCQIHEVSEENQMYYTDHLSLI